MTSDQHPDEVANRKQTNFTIEHILNRAGSSTSTQTSSSGFELFQFDDGACYQSTSQLKTESFDFQDVGMPFTWLQCTRYCPPKVPRKRDGPQKRQLGRHPRIPFTSQQLSILEEKFKQSPYLSSEEVTKLSKVLELADIRVKIWFQNRRARERREKLNLEHLPERTSPSLSSSPKQMFPNE